MRTTHKRAAVVTAIVLGLAAPAVMSASASEPTKGAMTSAATNAAHNSENRSEHPSEQRENGNRRHNKFVRAGTVSAVDATAGTITFIVHGGRDKMMRDKPLTVLVTTTTKIRRNGVDAKLSEVLVGDRVKVKGTKKDGVYTAIRVLTRTPEAAGTPDKS